MTTIDARDEAREPDQADGHPGEAEQALDAVDRHPRPGRAPDAQDRVGGRDDEERRGDDDAQLDQRAAEAACRARAP